MKAEITGDAEFIADLGKASKGVFRGATKLLETTGKSTQRATRRNVSNHPRWKKLSRTVTWEMQGPLAVEVGYEHKGQGKLANIAEFGTGKRAPNPALGQASENAAKRFHKGAEKLAKDLL